MPLPRFEPEPPDKIEFNIALRLADRFLSDLKHTGKSSLIPRKRQTCSIVLTLQNYSALPPHLRISPLSFNRRSPDEPVKQSLGDARIVRRSLRCGMRRIANAEWKRPCRARLSHRGRRLLLLGGLRADPRDRRETHHRC